MGVPNFFVLLIMTDDRRTNQQKDQRGHREVISIRVCRYGEGEKCNKALKLILQG